METPQAILGGDANDGDTDGPGQPRTGQHLESVSGRSNTTGDGTQAAIPATHGPVVMFHAHPDDEAVITGGTIAKLAELGVRVVCVFATRGELGEAPDGLLVAGQALGDRRSAEARWASNILGAGRVEFLDYHDSGMAGVPSNTAGGAFATADVDEAAALLASVVAEESASALVIYDDNGGYGHPDHIQVHRVGHRAAELLPTVGVYEATLNRDHLRKGLTDLALAGGEGSSAPALPDDFGKPASEITHTIDVAEHAALKRQAIGAHVSQQSEIGFLLDLPEASFQAGFGQEWFIERRKPASGNVFDEMAASLEEHR